MKKLFRKFNYWWSIRTVNEFGTRRDNIKIFFETVYVLFVIGMIGSFFFIGSLVGLGLLFQTIKGIVLW